MTSAAELGERVLRKIKAIGVAETPDAADLAAAVQSVKDAHQAFIVERLVRWTLADIPAAMDMPYVLVAAFIVADDFVVPKDASWWLQGMRQAQALANIPWQAEDVISTGDPSVGCGGCDYGGTCA